MDHYLSTYMKDYIWHDNPAMEAGDGSAEPPGQLCPHCGCVCTDCPQPQAMGPVHGDQTCQYFHQLRQRYPFLSQDLQMLPPEDMIVRLYHDRLRTAHLADPCQEGKAAAAAAPVMWGEAKADAKATGPCQCPKPPPCRTEPSELPEVVVTGRTEYQDTIGATGQGRKAHQHQ